MNSQRQDERQDQRGEELLDGEQLKEEQATEDKCDEAKNQHGDGESRPPATPAGAWRLHRNWTAGTVCLS